MNQLNQTSGNIAADKRAEYARLCSADHDYPAAVDVMIQSLELAPNWAVGWFQLAGYHEKMNAIDCAIDAYRRVISLTSQDYMGAGLKISFLKKAHSDCAPTAYAEALFDDYADKFDAALMQKLGYQVPSLLREILLASATQTKFPRAVDLGCGTGLMAAEVRHFADHISGIDISAKMLAKAHVKGLYDALVKADLEAGLSAMENIDLIMAADVFMYVPDLQRIFDAVARSLTAEGLFLFSVEKTESQRDWQLMESMRFAHSKFYIERLLEGHSFNVIDCREAVIRMDAGNPIVGLLFLAQCQLKCVEKLA